MLFVIIVSIDLFLLNFILYLARLSQQKVFVYLIATIFLLLLNSTFLFYNQKFLTTINFLLHSLVAQFWLKRKNRILEVYGKWIIILIFLTVLSVNISHRLQIIKDFPILPKHADMLPLIDSALDAFLSGENPYRIHQMPWRLPLTFLPLMWLSYLPFKLLSLDPRFNGLISICVVYSAFLLFSLKELSSLKYSSDSRRGVHWLNSLLILAIGSYFISAKSIVAFTPIAHTPIFWASLAILAASFFWSKQIFWPSLLLGISLSLRPTSLVLTPYLFIFYKKQHGWTGAIRFALISLGVLGVTCLPFVLSDPIRFFNGTVKHLYNMGRWVWSFRPEWVLNTFGFTGIFYYLQRPNFLPFLFLFSQAGLIFMAIRRLNNKTDCMIFMGLGLLLFSFFAPLPWIYIYFPCFLLLSFAAIFILVQNSYGKPELDH